MKDLRISVQYILLGFYLYGITRMAFDLGKERPVHTIDGEMLFTFAVIIVVTGFAGGFDAPLLWLQNG